MWGNEGKRVSVGGVRLSQVGLRRGEPAVELWLGDVGFVAELEGGVGNQDQG